MTEPRARLNPGFAIAAAGLAFLLTVSYAQQAERTKASAGRRAELAELVAARQDRAVRVGREIADLRSRVEALRGSGAAAGIQRDIDRLAVLAGTAAAVGPGVTVTLGDSPLAEEEESPDFRIQDVDLQLVVNELWAAGAEAVSVNGQRLVSTSAIRSAGQAILVNYKVLTSPYVVAAIGPRGALRDRFRRSQISDRFRTWTQVYRLRIDVSEQDRVRVPAFAGSVRLRHATPMPG